MDTTTHAPPEPDTSAAAAENSTGPPRSQPPTRDALRQVWPLDPDPLPRIVANLVAMTKPGVTWTRQKPNGQTVSTTISPRLNCRAAQLLCWVGALSLDQQKQDHEAQVHNGSLTLNDFVPPAGLGELVNQRFHAEARRRGLESIFQLDEATTQAVADQAEQDYSAEHGPIPQTGPTPAAPTPPEQRNDWVIPQEAQRQVMKHLCEMADPHGQAYPFLKLRQRLMATHVLLQLCRLRAAQVRWDRRVETGEKPFDWDAAIAEMMAKAREEDERCRREDAEDEASPT
jgi:hypothetical protein